MYEKDDLHRIAEAKKQIVDGSFTIWNTRLEALVNAGIIRDVLDHLTTAVEDKTNNCGCNVNCVKCSEAEFIPPVGTQR